MTIESVRRIVSNIPAGRFFRIAYKTQVPIKKEYKDEITILKITEMTTRTGVSYASVSDNYTETYENIHPYRPGRWDIFRKLKYHNKTGKYYLVVAPIKKGSNVNTYYQVNYKGVMHLVADLTDMFEDYVRPSYFKKSKTGGKVINIQVDNLLSINGEFE
mgnify:CR=1 FL=1